MKSAFIRRKSAAILFFGMAVFFIATLFYFNVSAQTNPDPGNFLPPLAPPDDQTALVPPPTTQVPPPNEQTPPSTDQENRVWIIPTPTGPISNNQVFAIRTVNDKFNHLNAVLFAAANPAKILYQQTYTPNKENVYLFEVIAKSMPSGLYVLKAALDTGQSTSVNIEILNPNYTPPANNPPAVAPPTSPVGTPPPSTSAGTQQYYITFTSPPHIIAGPTQISARSNEPGKVYFTLSKYNADGTESLIQQYSAVNVEDNLYYFICDTSKLSNGLYKIKVIGKGERNSDTDEITVRVNNDLLTNPPAQTNTTNASGSTLNQPLTGNTETKTIDGSLTAFASSTQNLRIYFSQPPAQIFSVVAGEVQASKPLDRLHIAAEDPYGYRYSIPYKYNSSANSYKFEWNVSAVPSGEYKITAYGEAIGQKAATTAPLRIETNVEFTPEIISKHKAAQASSTAANINIPKTPTSTATIINKDQTTTASVTKALNIDAAAIKSNNEVITINTGTTTTTIKIVEISTSTKPIIAQIIPSATSTATSTANLVPQQPKIPLQATTTTLVSETGRKPDIDPDCQAKKIIDFKACQEYLILNPKCKEEGITTKDNCERYMKNIPHDCLNNNLTNEQCVELQKRPHDCQQKGIYGKEKCQQYIRTLYLPAACKEKSITDPAECNDYLLKKFMPPLCQEYGAKTTEQCHAFLQEEHKDIDPACVKQNIYTPEACVTFLFEKKISLKEGSNNSALQLPAMCRDLGIDTAEACAVYLQNFNVFEECANITTKSQKADRRNCDDILFAKYGESECDQLQINNKDACRKYLISKYYTQLSCEGIDEWQCLNSINDHWLGKIAATQKQFHNIVDNKSEVVNKELTVQEFEEITNTAPDNIPVKNNKDEVFVINSQEKIIVNDKDSLIQSSPVIFMLENDFKKATNDIRKKLNLKAGKKPAAQEIKAALNANPQLLDKLTLVEQAIATGKKIEQPIVQGTTTPAMKINSVKNLAEAGYEIKGKAQPNSQITIFIYSTIPIFATVDVDENGNWKYVLDTQLKDGTHEVYVTVNDNTGKVVQKSNPFGFFIQEARAITIDEYAQERLKTSSKAQSASEVYVFISLGVILLGIILFLIYFIKSRKSKSF